MMNKQITTLVAVAVGLFLVQHAKAGDNPAFKAMCKDIVTHGYRAGTDIAGNPMEETWSTDERFQLTWEFAYDGQGHVTIDGKAARLLAQHPGVLILSDVPVTNGWGTGVWTYAIQLGMRKAVASQVNAHGGFEPLMWGVKARSTNLECEFQFE